ncbi:MAG: phosphoribosylamine--glycine ligase [Clostridiaceae bacterium]|jgi:phosphoribosylamine--glycine ligase|nr:phosphoribosylamine--glycine ligase [Clostridiaceae bacterium]
MNILVVGSGGREHAIVWKLAQSPKVKKIYCAPGNGGISDIAECLPINALDIEGMVNAAKEKKIDLVIVAPDDPLAKGMVNAMTDAGIRAFGPTKEAALIEASKAFSKELMRKYGIPTAEYGLFDDSREAFQYLKSHKYPLVVKADGLALGKGVLICQNQQEAEAAVISIMEEKKFGDSGNKIVIEEFITGPEVSILAFTDGKTIIPMVSSQDHKRALDGDKGLNTGGMGTFSPSRVYTPEIAELCMQKIFLPTIQAMNNEGRPFKGVLYFGLMLTESGPVLLEYNARFGDPETQVILPRLKTDLLEIFEAVIDEELEKVQLAWNDNACVCVVMASGGYPERYSKGHVIEGLDTISDAIVFHAGTKKENGCYYTNGGRVLGVTAMAETIEKARERAYHAVSCIHFQDAHFRRDIGIKSFDQP